VLAAFAAACVNIEFINNIYYNINMLNKSHQKRHLSKPLPRRRHPAGAAPVHGHDLGSPRRITVIFGGCERPQEPQSIALALSQAHHEGESALYGRERQSLRGRGGVAKGTQAKGLN
jgi:hypothetical protein